MASTDTAVTNAEVIRVYQEKGTNGAVQYVFGLINGHGYSTVRAPRPKRFPKIYFAVRKVPGSNGLIDVLINQSDDCQTHCSL